MTACFFSDIANLYLLQSPINEAALNASKVNRNTSSWKGYTVDYSPWLLMKGLYFLLWSFTLLMALIDGKNDGIKCSIWHQRCTSNCRTQSLLFHVFAISSNDCIVAFEKNYHHVLLLFVNILYLTFLEFLFHAYLHNGSWCTFKLTTFLLARM